MSNTSTLNDPKIVDPNIAQQKAKEAPVPPAIGPEYDYVYSFFRGVMKDENAAKNFTYSLYEVSAASQISVVELVKSMEGQSSIQVNVSMAYYLNNIRSSSTMLGVQNTVKPNYYAARNMLV